MIEHWQRTMVTGQRPDGLVIPEMVLHKRGQDPLNMAIRRNPDMPGCYLFTMDTMEAFTQIREDERRRTAEDIPRDDRQGEEFDW